MTLSSVYPWWETAEKTWKTLGTVYFVIVVVLTFASAGGLVAEQGWCFTEADLLCVMPPCAAKQEASNKLSGVARWKASCFDGSVMPCHERFWFVLMTWITMCFTLLDAVTLYYKEYLIQQAGLKKSGQAVLAEITWFLRDFGERIRVIWCVVLLFQVYIAPNSSAYLTAMISTEICSLALTSCFRAQLSLVTIELIGGFFFFFGELVIYMISPPTQAQVMARAIEQSEKALALEHRQTAKLF